MEEKITTNIRDIFGENCQFDLEKISRISENVSALQREVKGIVYPKNTQEIQQLVRLANEYRFPLYPISTGKNWGFGSRLPVKDGAVVVQLSQMNHIHNIDSHFGYAVIEPGVTQGQLYEALVAKNLENSYNINPTGSGKDTSLMGNCLDRGVGYLSTRAGNILNLEVVLGNGDIIQTGFGHYPHTITQHLYRYGVGPSLDGLFMQSNLGIVTKATYTLSPILSKNGAVICGLEKAECLKDFVDRLYALRRRGIIQTAFHIGNSSRVHTTLLPFLTKKLSEKKMISPFEAERQARSFLRKRMNNTWTAIGGIGGEKRAFRETFQIIKKEMSKFGKVSLISDSKSMCLKKTLNRWSFIDRFYINLLLLESLEFVYNLTKGIPTDEALKSLYTQTPIHPGNYTDPDQSSLGLLFVTPLIPMSGEAAAEVEKLTKDIFGKYGFQDYLTMNMGTSTTLECVINLLFDRDDEREKDSAHECIAELSEKFIKRGFLPYRTGIHLMDQIVDEQDAFWQTVKKIKLQTDPNNVISPGRYSLI